MIFHNHKNSSQASTSDSPAPEPGRDGGGQAAPKSLGKGSGEEPFSKGLPRPPEAAFDPAAAPWGSAPAPTGKEAPRHLKTGAGWGGWARGAPQSLNGKDRHDRVIALVDMNAFFAQVEQRCNPALRGKPVLVGGNPTTRTIVTAASYEAKARGVKTAMSYHEALRLVPDAIIVEGSQEKYLSYCNRLGKIFREFTDLVEMFSIDEAFMDLTPVLRLWDGPEAIGRAIKRRVKEELDLTCSVGIGPNRLVAKMASDWKKPDGLVVVRPEELPHVLWPHPVDEIVGVGRRMKAHLNALGITTIGRLARYDVEILKRRFGMYGQWMHERAHGIDPTPVDAQGDAPVRSMGHSYTLPRNTSDPETIRWFYLWLSDKVARRLRADDYRARTISMIARFPDMHTISHSITLPEPTWSGHEIAAAAWDLFRKHIPIRTEVRLLGVASSALVRGRTYQLCLDQDLVRAECLLNAVDAIKDKYGADAITCATLLGGQRSLLRPKIGFFLTRPEKKKAGVI